MKIDRTYPWMWGLDSKSFYKSLWLGWWLVTWTMDSATRKWWQTVRITFQPGL